MIDPFLTQELSRQVDEYKAEYEAEDHMEWGLVLGEIEAFTEVGSRSGVLHIY